MMVAALLLASASLDPESYQRAVAITHDPANLYVSQCLHDRSGGGFTVDKKCSNEQTAARNRIIDKMEMLRRKWDAGDDRAGKDLAYMSAMICLAGRANLNHIDYVKLDKTFNPMSK